MSKYNSQKIVTINSRKFDGTIHKSWKAEFLDQKENLLSFVGKFEKEINHSKLGVIRRGSLSFEFYWLDGWFNVFQFFEPNGKFRNFYCNLNLPPIFKDKVLDYVDLDIDVLVWKDFSMEILDLDEFDENSKKFNYSQDIRNKTKASLKKLLELIETRNFPFNIKI